MTRCAGSMLLTYADMSLTQFCTGPIPCQRVVMPTVHADSPYREQTLPHGGINSRCCSHVQQDSPPAAVLDTVLMTQHHRPITELIAGAQVCDGTMM